jgi:hypothetical protein
MSVPAQAHSSGFDVALSPPNHATLEDALISLNNSAIQILELGKCRSCIETLKDALELMKSTTTITSTTTATNTNDNTEVLSSTQSYASTAVARAQRRIAEATEEALLHENNRDQNSGSTDLGVVVLSSQHDPQEAYNLLATLRTSKVCLTMDPGDSTLDVRLVRSILVYNYGIAHRCFGLPEQPAPATTTGTHHGGGGSGSNSNKLGGFCLQIFQYAETLLPEGITSNHLYRLVLTRNLMMLSCRLGMSLCEHYRETLDPIEAEILGPLMVESSTTTSSAGGGGGTDEQPGASAA